MSMTNGIISHQTSTATRVAERAPVQTRNQPVRVSHSKRRQADPIGTVTVTANALNVRSGAGSNYGRIGGLTKGKQVQYFEEKDGWLQIAYGSETGWISAAHTDYTAPSNPPAETGLFDVTISVNNYLNVRPNPNTNNDPIGKLYNGDKVTVYEEKDGWYRIHYDNQDAWISAQYAHKTGAGNDPDPGPATGGSPGDIAAAEAKRLMKIYVDNGYTYSQGSRQVEGHYDCSSFTHRCWAAAGLDLKWATAAGQAQRIVNAGGKVSENNIQPGDLLFWSYKENGRYENISHVAIAIDSSTKIDAGGTPVKQAKIENPKIVGRPSVLL